MNLDTLLKEETKEEKYNLSIQHDSYMMKPILLEDGINKVTEKDYPFFEYGYIYISKHSRYAKMVNHNHSFVELNYMYSGSCIQYVDKQKIFLKQGQLLLMDKDTAHSIDRLEKSDILINILLQNESISTEILTKIVQSQSLIFDFLFNASHQETDHRHFLILDTQDNEVVQFLLYQMMSEYFMPNSHSQQKLKLLLPLLFIELSQQLEKQTIGQIDSHQKDMMEILLYIDQHYQSISLEQLAKNFGYNKNYISNKIKALTQHTFLELLERKRLKMAIAYMQDGQYSMEQISYLIGYESPASFFKLFKKYYHMTPLQFQKKLSKNDKFVI